VKGPLYAIYATLNAEGGHSSHARTDLRYVFPLQVTDGLTVTSLYSWLLSPAYSRVLCSSSNESGYTQ